MTLDKLPNQPRRLRALITEYDFNVKPLLSPCKQDRIVKHGIISPRLRTFSPKGTTDSVYGFNVLFGHFSASSSYLALLSK